MRIYLVVLAVIIVGGCGPAAHSVKDGDGCSNDVDCMVGSCCACTNCDIPTGNHHQCEPLEGGVCPRAG